MRAVGRRWRSRFRVRHPCGPAVYGLLGVLAAHGEWAEAVPGGDGREWRTSAHPDAFANLARRAPWAVVWGSVVPDHRRP